MEERSREDELIISQTAVEIRISRWKFHANIKREQRFSTFGTVTLEFVTICDHLVTSVTVKNGHFFEFVTAVTSLCILSHFLLRFVSFLFSTQ